MAEELPMPLDVMLHTMRQYWREGRVEDAITLAKAAAPYLHAKPGAGRVAASLADMEDGQLDELCRRSIDRADPKAGDTD